ncbi:SMC-Scp complex subunit ScpB [Geopsychrobacter electrodiphilus]|uniref:SMC-Scp complex subunit ScpB n=1 Tax=Geopsychrobacter electrodiphilus TaxID=225196 RepID=UPI00035EC034|nr:SMC-Scp complex subunit ScpB [Geopsychrobacter electrodiphilus]
MDERCRAVAALIFAAEGPMSLDRLCLFFECQRAELRPVIDRLLEAYPVSRGGFYLAEIAGGYQFRTDPDLSHWLGKLNRDRPFRFSPAALETLAMIAYRQPVTRGEIEYLRGVDSGGVLKTLLDKGFLRILGKKDVPGRPLMYGTSRNFLEFFGLKDLSDLPTLREFTALDPGLDSAADLQTESGLAPAEELIIEQELKDA